MFRPIEVDPATRSAEFKVKDRLVPLFKIPFYHDPSKKRAAKQPDAELVAKCQRVAGDLHRALATVLKKPGPAAQAFARELIDGGASLEIMNEKGETAIYWAGLSGDEAQINFLLHSCGLHPLYAGVPGAPARGNLFHALCANGHAKLVKEYYNKPEFRAGLFHPSTKSELTPIEEAVVNREFACAKTLLEMRDDDEQPVLDPAQRGFKGFNLLGIALGRLATEFVGEATEAEWQDLETLLNYLLDEKQLDAFATDHIAVPIKALLIEDLILQNSQSEPDRPDESETDSSNKKVSFAWISAAFLIEKLPKLASKLYTAANNHLAQGRNDAALEFKNACEGVEPTKNHPYAQ